MVLLISTVEYMKQSTLEEFLNKLTTDQLEKYDFSEFAYVNIKTKSKVLCKRCNTHFLTTPKSALNKYGCAKCSMIDSSVKRRGNIEDFIVKANEKFNGRYTYEKAVYVGYRTKLEITCSEHGSFWKKPEDHMRNQGCPTCSRSPYKGSLESFIEKANEKWSSLYTYEKCVYVNIDTKMEMTCKVHGSFWKSAYRHLKGQGCQKCKTEEGSPKLSNIKEFINKATEKWKGLYTYEKAIYVNSTTKLEITCSKHGSFWKLPCNHLGGQGCQKCSFEGITKRQLKTTEYFINKVKSLSVAHSTIDFSKTVYTNTSTPVILGCNEHGYYEQTPESIYARYNGCRGCNNWGVSAGEQKLVEFVKSLGFDVLTKKTGIIGRQELDIVIPDKKIAIEYDGLYWHSEARKTGKDYHLNKTLSCEKAGYRLIHVYEDEWIRTEDIVKSRLSHILGVSTSNKLDARKLSIVKLSYKDSVSFLESTHIQGSGKPPKYSYGLINGTELVACMTFCKERFKNSDNIELLRFSSKYAIRGGFSKLLKAFIRDNNYKGSIVSFSDKRWSAGDVYKVNGFELDSTSNPGYDYVYGTAERFDRQRFMKHKLPNLLLKFDPNLTEAENCKNNGYYRIWNCGMDKWVLTV